MHTYEHFLLKVDAAQSLPKNEMCTIQTVYLANAHKISYSLKDVLLLRLLLLILLDFKKIVGLLMKPKWSIQWFKIDQKN